MDREQITDIFTAVRAWSAEGARVGIATCTLCGASVLIDPSDTASAMEVHAKWHFSDEKEDPEEGPTQSLADQLGEIREALKFPREGDEGRNATQLEDEKRHSWARAQLTWERDHFGPWPPKPAKMETLDAYLDRLAVWWAGWHQDHRAYGMVTVPSDPGEPTMVGISSVGPSAWVWLAVGGLVAGVPFGIAWLLAS